MKEGKKTFFLEEHILILPESLKREKLKVFSCRSLFVR